MFNVIIPKYEIFDAPISGTTRPVVVSASTELNQMESIVLKIFSDQKDMGSFSHVTKEFYASFLAKEFNLKVPKAYIVDLKSIDSLAFTKETYHRITKLYPKMSFGSEYISPQFNYTPALRRKNLKAYDLETIFAFDLLIHNLDRRIERPNIFFTGKEPVLIDHDLALDIQRTAREYLQEPMIYYRIAKGLQNGQRAHIFYKTLRRNKSSLDFGEFEYCLNNVNLRTFKALGLKLEQCGFNTLDFERIYDYINESKSLTSSYTKLFREILNIK